MVKIRSIGSKGEGIGDLDGKTLFVEGALVGEEVEVSVVEEKRRWARGKLTKVVEPSPERVTPPCPFYDRCGGCQLMHLSYEGQLDVKRQRVQDALERIGKLTVSVDPCLASPSPLHYRNKIQLPVAMGANGIECGLYARGSHDVVPVDRCLIHCEGGEEVYSVVRDELSRSPVLPYNEKSGKGDLRHLLIRTSVSHNESLVIFVTTGRNTRAFSSLAERIRSRCPSIRGVICCVNRSRGNAILSKELTLLSGEPTIRETIDGLTFRVSTHSFFQVNPLQARNLYHLALEFADLTSESVVMDAYCGVGTLALLAASKAKKVYGIEVVESAISDAEQNAKENKITNAEFFCSTVESALERFKGSDVVLLNPPRKGCHGALLDALLEQGPERIVYVSCDPATLARDLNILSARYRVDRAQPVDMFPQTAHVETVVKLSRVAEKG